ncbi:glycerate kinase [Arthrobacter sp. ZGTC212]|uniref:glycerate kinase n=1 Tax=Arthrobacter sp. ZGTC212 TaxID=2058899 RepID=UPI0021584B93|nr:glycerate kinase [Arthrobacter sp. ZGTC212]
MLSEYTYAPALLRCAAAGDSARRRDDPARTEPHPVEILVAPDSFKGMYSAAEVATNIAAGIRSTGGTAEEMPVADGGEGTFDVVFSGLTAQPPHPADRWPPGAIQSRRSSASAHQARPSWNSPRPAD